jgi:intracellular sulfur oxidation DsrE/DsrF family protein
MDRFRRTVLSLASGLAAAGLATAPRAARAQSDSRPKVVWHVDFAEPARLSALIQNVNNMVTTYEGELLDFDVRVVFLAGGIRFVTEDPLRNTPFAEDAGLRARRPELLQRLKQLRDLHNVKLEYCTLTIEAIGLPKERIIPGVGAVRSGVVRIAELQSRGYAYLKVA